MIFHIFQENYFRGCLLTFSENPNGYEFCFVIHDYTIAQSIAYRNHLHNGFDTIRKNIFFKLVPNKSSNLGSLVFHAVVLIITLSKPSTRSQL